MFYSLEFLLLVYIICDHDSLYVSKVKPVSKIHAKSCNRKMVAKSSNLNHKAPERCQRCSGV